MAKRKKRSAWQTKTKVVPVAKVVKAFVAAGLSASFASVEKMDKLAAVR